MATPRKTPQTADVRIGQRIRFRRKEVGLAQADLAAACGITFQQVQKYENGRNRVGGSRMVEIARALQVTPAYFFGDVAGMPAIADAVALSGLDLSLAREAARLSERHKVAVRHIIRTLVEASEPIAARAA